MTHGRGKPIRLLEVDPDLGQHLRAEAFERARHELVVPSLVVEPGRWDPRESLSEPDPLDLGVFVVEGLLTRDVVIGGRSCAELLGPGDVLRPLQPFASEAVISTRVEWRVLDRARIAILSKHALRVLTAYPEIMVALVTRAVVRAQTLAVVLAISCATRLEVRVLAVLWHLADRFGKVSPQGVVLPLPLTHQVISRLVGASRPSVSTTVKQLEADGRIARQEEGGYLLLGEPPELQEATGAGVSAARGPAVASRVP